jgi:predicted acetyltransferase
MYKLVKATKEYKKQIIEYKTETLLKENSIHGSSAIHAEKSFEKWMNKIKKTNNRDNIPPNSNLVESSQWVLVDKKLNVLGMVNIRHELNDGLLHEGGHIGYSVRPSYRNQGLGKIQLKLALEKIKELGQYRVLITCDDKNLASAKVIEACGGVLDNIVVSTNENKKVRRYWIKL